MDYNFLGELATLISQIGIGNFIIVILSLFAVSNLPSIIDKIINRKNQNARDKQHAQDMTFLRTQITNIWEEVRRTDVKIDEFNRVLGLQTQKVDSYTQIAMEQNKQRVAENFAITNSIDNVVDSIDSIEKMMRNVMSEKDAIGLISLKMGSILDFKTKLEASIMNLLTSGKKNGQIEMNINAIISSEWLDLKSELEAFSFPFSVKNFFDNFESELWKDDGMFSVIKNMTLNDVELDRKMASISKQLDMGLRNILANISTYLEENKKKTNGATR